MSARESAENDPLVNIPRGEMISTIGSAVETAAAFSSAPSIRHRAHRALMVICASGGGRGYFALGRTRTQAHARPHAMRANTERDLARPRVARVP